MYDDDDDDDEVIRLSLSCNYHAWSGEERAVGGLAEEERLTLTRSQIEEQE